MPRAKLAHWHEGHAPGEDIDIDDDRLKELQRDGRIAEVLNDTIGPTPAPATTADPSDPTEMTVSAPEDVSAKPPTKGRRAR